MPSALPVGTRQRVGVPTAVLPFAQPTPSGAKCAATPFARPACHFTFRTPNVLQLDTPEAVNVRPRDFTKLAELGSDCVFQLLSGWPCTSNW